MPIESLKRWLSRVLIALSVSAAYLYAYPSATISYGVVDLFHIAAGIVFAVLLFAFFLRLLPAASPAARLGWVLLGAGALLGIVLIKVGTPTRLKPWLLTHIALCVLGAVFVLTSWLSFR